MTLESLVSVRYFNCRFDETFEIMLFWVFRSVSRRYWACVALLVGTILLILWDSLFDADLYFLLAGTEPSLLGRDEEFFRPSPTLQSIHDIELCGSNLVLSRRRLHDAHLIQTCMAGLTYVHSIKSPRVQ